MSEWDAGMGTTPGMWQILSDLLDGEKLPDSLNEALYALCEKRAMVVLKGTFNTSPDNWED